jgi:hypothetical protein
MDVIDAEKELTNNFQKEIIDAFLDHDVIDVLKLIEFLGEYGYKNYTLTTIPTSHGFSILLLDVHGVGKCILN